MILIAPHFGELAMCVVFFGEKIAMIMGAGGLTWVSELSREIECKYIYTTYYSYVGERFIRRRVFFA